MPGPVGQYYRLRIRNAANTADQIVVTSVRAGTNPYLLGPPHGDGASYNPLTGESMLGAYTIQIADWPIGGSQRVMTSQLEDAGLRQQLAYRATILEMGTDGASFPTVLIAGILSLLRLVDAMTYEATIQDPMRAMEQSTLFSPASTLPLATWFSQWLGTTPVNMARGCLAGGPLWTPAGSGGVGPLAIRDLGGWEMRVEGLRIDQYNSQFYVLRPRVVYGAPQWIANEKSNLNDFAEQINNAAAQYQTQRFDGRNNAWSTISDAMLNAYAWTGVTWLVDKQDGAGFIAWKPYPFDQFGIVYKDRSPQFNQSLISNFSGNWGIAVMSDGTKTLTAGALVKVRALTVLPTEQCPLYLSGNPCDLLAKLWGSIPNLSWDQAALDAIKATVVGDDCAITFRITGPMKLVDLVNQIVQPLGLGIRGDSLGRLQVFDGRLGVLNTLPSIQINAADVIDGTTSLPFELDPALAAKTIIFTQSRYTDQRNAPFNHDNSIVDGVVVGTDTLTMINIDPSALPYGALDWRTDGSISSKQSAKLLWQQYILAHAQRIFDRFGRGGIGFETTLIRGGAGETLNLGDEALINLPQIPNHNYRLGDNPATAARRMQITRRTVLPEGYAVRFDDSGPNAQPLATVPVLSITTALDAPRTVAVVTITNAASINGLGYGVRLQWAVTTGAAPAAGQWTDVTAWSPGTVPTTGIRLPPVTSGTVVYARARCELASQLPSNWSTAVSVVLSTINPPTGLTITPNASDGSLATLRWTPGAGTTVDFTDIWLRLSGQAFGLATRLHVLSPGSVQYVIEGLTPGQGYIASVQHRDPLSEDVSAAVDISFVAGGTQRVLTKPANPAGFAGTVDPETGVPNRDGTFGIGVLAAEFPGFLEVQVAVETGIASGAYGAFATQAVSPAIASVQGNWTKATFIAPNDGLRRQLKARHVLDGCTPSAYTTPVVTVLPWTFQPLPPLPTNVIVQLTQLDASPATDAGKILRFQANAIDPFGQPTQVAVMSVVGTGVAIVSGPALGVFSPNDTVWKVSLPAPGSGPGTIVVRGQTADGRTADVTLALPEETTLAQPSATITFDPISGDTARRAYVSWTASCAKNAQSVKWFGTPSHQPSTAEVLASGFMINGTIDGNNFQAVNFDTVTLGDTFYVTIVPFTGPSATGTQLPSVQLRARFTVWGKQKTAFFRRTAWDTGSPRPMTTDENGFKLNATLGTSVIRDRHYFYTVLPIGSALVSASFGYWWDTTSVPASTVMGSFSFGVDANATTLNFANAVSGTSQAIREVVVGLANTVITTAYVALNVQFSPQVLAGATAAQCALSDSQLTYIAPTQDVNV